MGTNNKLREALEELMKFTCNSCERRLCEDDAEEVDGQIVSSPCSAIIGARNALAAPPRNYEVGTVEQQAKRFEEYCESEVCKRKRCKSRAKALCIERCALAWAQMPYEKGDDK